jgi:hypothetical protein
MLNRKMFAIGVTGLFVGLLCLAQGQERQSLKYISAAQAAMHGKFVVPSVPAVAAANGLNRLAFYDNFNSTTTIDFNHTGNPGYKWFLNNAWPNAPAPFQNWGDVRIEPATPASSVYIGHGAVNLSNGNSPPAASGVWAGHFMQTAQASGSTYVGQGFVPPMYVQYSVQLTLGGGDVTAWPALWMQPLEFLTGSAPIWTELDGFEYFVGNPGTLIMTVHINNFTAQSQAELNNNTVTQITDTNPHTLAFLWLPANGAVNGTIKYYIDGVEQTGAGLSYASGSDGAHSDNLHMMLNLTTGDVLPVSFQYVGVWQQ